MLWAMVRLRAPSVVLVLLVLFSTHSTPLTTFGDLALPEQEIIVQQDGLSWTIFPLIGDESPSDFYSYAHFQSESPLVQGGNSVLFLYAHDQMLNLFIIHSARRDGTSERVASFDFGGLPRTAFTLVKDDPDDSYWLSPPSGTITWRWSQGFTDGVVLGGLTGEFAITIYPQFNDAITRWLLISGSVQGLQYSELPSLNTPVTLQVRLPDPAASFTYLPTAPIVGESVSFEASASRSSAGPIVQYSWDFDGNGLFDLSSFRPSTTYTFETPGDYAVALRIVDSLGRTASQTTIVPVSREAIRVTRLIKTFLPDFQTLPDYHLFVELLIETNMTVFGLGFKEEPPEGWRIQPMENGGAQLNTSNSLEWVFLETLHPGTLRKLTYRVDVPPGEEPGVYRFTGQVVSGSPQVISTIQGDSEVRVIRSLSIELAISHLSDKGEIDLTLGNYIRFNQILQAVALWQEGKPVPETDGKRIDLNMMVRLVAYWLTDTPTNQSLPAGSG